jgi:predicted lipid-binding transport protein (Tim44 family)
VKSIKLLASLTALSALLAACGPTAAPKPAAPAPAPAAAPAAAKAASPAAGNVADRMRRVAAEVDSALTALGAGDLAKARDAYEEFDGGWEDVEDDVKAKSPDAYKAIEDAMDEVEAALTKADKPDPARARDTLTKLKQTIDANLAALR